jgi:tetratricopeptide (TPR) repeat protein
LDHAAFFGPGAIVLFDAVSCNISGDAHYQAGRLDMAMKEYKAGLSMNPANANLLNSLGVCLAKRNKLRKARAAFAAAVRSDPQESFALYNLGVIQSIHQNQDRALEHLKEAYALNRETFEIPFQIGKILCDQGRYDQAASYIEAALRKRGADSAAHRLLGDCLVATGNQARALSAYKTAVKLNPNDAVALSALGALYSAVDENPEVCMAFLEQSVAIDPKNGLFQHRLARFYHERNQLRQALQAYEKAVDLGHDSHRQVSELRNQIGSAHP